jgi:hypothetical protein
MLTSQMYLSSIRVSVVGMLVNQQFPNSRNPGAARRRAHRSYFDEPHYCLVLIRRQPESKPIVSTWVTLMPDVSARRRYVRFGFARNNYCHCANCVAHPPCVIRLGVQGSCSGVGPVAVPRSSVYGSAPGTRDIKASGMTNRTCRFRRRSQDCRHNRTLPRL